MESTAHSARKAVYLKQVLEQNSYLNRVLEQVCSQWASRLSGTALKVQLRYVCPGLLGSIHIVQELRRLNVQVKEGGNDLLLN